MFYHENLFQQFPAFHFLNAVKISMREFFIKSHEEFS